MPNSEKHDEKDRAEAKLERLLLEGLRSVNGIEANEEFWERQRQRIIEKARTTGTPTWRKRERL